MEQHYEFTLKHYQTLLKKAKQSNYTFINYEDYEKFNGKYIILRHDIDISLEKALEMAKIESLEGISATYFLMLTSEFYNVLSPYARKIVEEMSSLGHQIGLHFDPTTYHYSTKEELENIIQQEVQILSSIIQKKVTTLSFHRPSKEVLENNYQFEGLINTYSHVFFKDIKYISDSRKRWREETIDELIEKELFSHIQLLIHPIWWESENGTLNDSISHFIEQHNRHLFEKFSNNISNFPLEFKKKLDSIKIK